VRGPPTGPVAGVVCPNAILLLLLLLLHRLLHLLLLPTCLLVSVKLRSFVLTLFTFASLFFLQIFIHATVGIVAPPPAISKQWLREPNRPQCKQCTVGSKRTLKGPRALFSKINFLHGAQAKDYVCYAEFQGLSDAVIAF